MNISYNWLKEYVDFSLSPEEVAQALTSIGLEVGGVEAVESVKGGLRGLVVGQVLTCEAHPNSDHMHVTTVDLGSGEPVQIVCGAPNVAAGQKVIVATLGTKLYNGDEEFTIKKAKLRGVESNGMICAEDEIGIGTSHAGIIVLPEEAKVGTPAAEYYKLDNDYLIEVDITPNRADACSHYGVARDLYAYLVQNGYATAKHKPSVDAFKVDNHELDIEVEVRNPEACPQYTGVTVKGVTVKESPDWLKKHLSAIGLRPINNIVDITNYICHAFGHPMHCFDADKIKGGKIVVQTLPKDTPFVTLDGVERKLHENDLMICNAEEPMCMGGVFGGLDSGTTEQTTNVFLESAYFHPTWIRKSARRHGLSTDSSFRYERGVDPNNTIYCLKLAALLVKELAGGTISSEIKNVQAHDFPPFRVELAYDYVNRLIGKDIPQATVRSIAESLEMEVAEEKPEGLTLLVPPYRVDVQRPCDVVEDILRVYGYNNVEISTALTSSLVMPGETDRSNKLQDLVSEQLIGAGFNEILNNSLTRSAYYEGNPVYPIEACTRLMNPLSADLSVLRQTLLYGGLESIARNINHKHPDISLFEFGNCYFCNPAKRNPQYALAPYREEYHLALWTTGKRVQHSWLEKDSESNIYQLEAHVLNVFARLGIGRDELAYGSVQNELLSASIAYNTKGGKTLALIGMPSKKVLKEFDIEQPVFYAEINWNEVMKLTQKKQVHFTEIAKYPTVKRDLALLVDAQTPFAKIEQIAYETDKRLVKKVELFDVYEGDKLPAGKKSYAVSFTLQDEERTLNDKAIEHVMNRLVDNLKQKLNAELR